MDDPQNYTGGCCPKYPPMGKAKAGGVTVIGQPLELHARLRDVQTSIMHRDERGTTDGARVEDGKGRFCSFRFVDVPVILPQEVSSSETPRAAVGLT